MEVGDAYVFPGFLTPVITQLFFPKPLTTFLTCFCRGEKQKYTGKKVCLHQRSNSQPPGHESDMLTTEPPGWGNAFQSFMKLSLVRTCLIYIHISMMDSSVQQPQMETYILTGFSNVAKYQYCKIIK